jgi:hypothetical protein
MAISSENSPLIASYPENNNQLIKLFIVLISYSLLFGIIDVLISRGLKATNVNLQVLNSFLMLGSYSLTFIYTIKHVRKHQEQQTIQKEFAGYTFTASVIALIIIATISLAILLDPLTSFIPVPNMV